MAGQPTIEVAATDPAMGRPDTATGAAGAVTLPWGPTSRVAVMAVLGLLICLAAYFLVICQPWLGVQFRAHPSGHGLVVEGTSPGSPNARLRPGDIVVALGNADHQEAVGPASFRDTQGWITSFGDYNALREHHRMLRVLMRSNTFHFVRLDGTHVPARAAGRRPFVDLPWPFWVITLSGFTTFMIGAGIWALRPGWITARLLWVAAAGFLLQAVSMATLTGRELALAPGTLAVAYELADLGTLVVVYALIALLWHYPQPQRRFPITRICAATVAVLWLNEVLQLADVPTGFYVAHYLLVLAAMATLTLIKWRATRDNAVRHAQVKWVGIGVTVVVGVWMFLFVIPVVYAMGYAIPMFMAQLLGPLLLLSFALGITRYRLFELDRWWAEIWFWLAGGLVIIALDIALMWLLDLGDLQSLGLAIILAGWVYFPLRQWLFRKLLRRARTRLDDHLPLLVTTLFADGPTESYAERWQAILRTVFSPLTLSTHSGACEHPAVADAGQALLVPALDRQGVHTLRYRERGQQFYTPRDADLAATLLALTRHITALCQAREQGMREERTRIMRDLHDDVAGRLLSVVHRTRDAAAQGEVRDALQALRQTIYALDDQQPIQLADLLIELQAVVRERLRDTDVTLDWHESPRLPAVAIAPRPHVNLLRVMQEAVTNAVRHARPQHVAVDVTADGGQLHIRLHNDGDILQTEDWQTGKGVTNINQRMTEIGGQARWHLIPPTDSDVKRCCLELTFALPGTEPTWKEP